MKKNFLRNFAKFTGKHLCQGLFFSKVAGLRPTTLSKKTLWHRCFPVNFAKFPRAPFLQSTSKQLLLRPLIYFYTSWKQQKTTGFLVVFKWYDGATRIEWVAALTSSCFKVFQYLCKIRSSYERFSVK